MDTIIKARIACRAICKCLFLLFSLVYLSFVTINFVFIQPNILLCNILQNEYIVHIVLLFFSGFMAVVSVVFIVVVAVSFCYCCCHHSQSVLTLLIFLISVQYGLCFLSNCKKKKEKEYTLPFLQNRKLLPVSGSEAFRVYTTDPVGLSLRTVDRKGRGWFKKTGGSSLLSRTSRRTR